MDGNKYRGGRIMFFTTAEITIDHHEGSSIGSPAWGTSGVSSWSQVMVKTEGFSHWSAEPATAIGQAALYDFEDEQLDLSKMLLQDNEFRKSIDRARHELRRGDVYFDHEDVFGE